MTQSEALASWHIPDPMQQEQHISWHERSISINIFSTVIRYYSIFIIEKLLLGVSLPRIRTMLHSN